MILSWIVARRAQWCVLLWLREHTDTRAQCASKLYVTKRSHRSRKRTWKTNYKHTVNGFSSLFTFKALKFMLMPVFTSAHRSNFITWSIKALFLSITNECRWSFFSKFSSGLKFTSNATRKMHIWFSHAWMNANNWTKQKQMFNLLSVCLSAVNRQSIKNMHTRRQNNVICKFHIA